MTTRAELEWMLAGFDPDSHRRGPDTDGSPCCPAHTLMDRAERAEEALRYIIDSVERGIYDARAFAWHARNALDPSYQHTNTQNVEEK